MSPPWSKQWFKECNNFHGRILNGIYAHWCPNAHNLPIDETDIWHWGFCTCFDCKCGRTMKPKTYPFGRSALEIHDDIFICPARQFWNFWKHPDRNKYNRQWKVEGD